MLPSTRRWCQFSRARRLEVEGSLTCFLTLPQNEPNPAITFCTSLSRSSVVDSCPPSRVAAASAPEDVAEDGAGESDGLVGVELEGDEVEGVEGRGVEREGSMNPPRDLLRVCQWGNTIASRAVGRGGELTPSRLLGVSCTVGVVFLAACDTVEAAGSGVRVRGESEG